MAALCTSLLGHAWMLDALPEGLGRQAPLAPVPAMTVRSIELSPPTPPAPADDPPAAAPPPPAPSPAARRVARSAPLARPPSPPLAPALAPDAADPSPAVAPEPAAPNLVAAPEAGVLKPPFVLTDAVPEPRLPEAAPAWGDGAASAAMAAAAAPSASVATSAAAPASVPAGMAELPVYATRVPPSARLRYELRRGMISGAGELLWQLQPSGAYELRLEGKIAFVRVLTQVSQGQLDSAGLAPTRFTDQRQSKPAQAANFQREQGVLSFSGPAATYALRPGLQDRLSWMVQLPAIVAANPMLAEPGATITLGVAGVGGSLDAWVFRADGPETVDTGLGPVQALRYTRVPRQPYDTTVEAWLDPARHHLPVHARLTDAKFSLDFVLEAWSSPP